MKELEFIPDARSTQALQRASHSSDPTIRLGAVAALLMRNDISGLQLAAETLLHAWGGAFSPGVTEGLVIGISWVKDPRAVPALETLLERGDDAVRRAAARALANTSSPDGTDALARALYDPDQQVRFWAVLGLADITGQKSWRPSVLTYRDREAEYLSHWRDWAMGR